jgi:hypothetical protein
MTFESHSGLVEGFRWDDAHSVPPQSNCHYEQMRPVQGSS